MAGDEKKTVGDQLKAIAASWWFQLFVVPAIGVGMGAACHALPPAAEPVCEAVVGIAESGLKQLGSGSTGGGAGGVAPAVPVQAPLRMVDCGPGGVANCDDKTGECRCEGDGGA
ncbi:MAG: hypothetical protein QM723_07010 [Myxococcaceae bacterium]